MNFHLEFPVSSFSKKINYHHEILLMGSCFSENIGDAMKRYKFNTGINPHGILYNPASIAVALRSYINYTKVGEKDLFNSNGRWHSWQHHSRFSDIDKQACLDKINKSISAGTHLVRKGAWLFITFGSAFVYQHILTHQLVGNCHKIPPKEFTKSMLSVNEIINDYTLLIAELRNQNPDLKIVFTVSPVRYVRDGVVENNLSKALLIQAVHELVKLNEGVFYFPAYELVIDDLRDYRFYESDLVHPTGQAIDYVFEKFATASFDNETLELLNTIRKIVAAKEHKPFDKKADAHRKFKIQQLEFCEGLSKQYPYLNFEEEILFFSSEK